MKRFKPGVGFSDFVIVESKITPSKLGSEKMGPRHSKRSWMWVGVMAVMGLLVVRLAVLQLLYGGRYAILSDENRVKRIKLPAPRGVISDRNGVELSRDQATAHVIGYVGEVSEEEVGLLKEAGKKYEAGSWIGRSGIEEQYESRLRGIDGGRLVEVDNAGREARELGRQEPVRGEDLQLSIDGDLQKTAFEAMEGKKGAAVASNPKTGEVLVLVSSPSFDPKKVHKALGNKDLPLLNRAIGGVYPPGSTFKMVTAAAAITEEKVSPNFSYEDTGVIKIGSFSYTNWFFTSRGKVEGVIGWSRAIARSTDTFFYKVGEMTGAETMAEWARKMGLGEKMGIDLPGEVEGLIPTPEWKKKVKGELWFLGNTYHMAIGQGDILVTPAQVNVMTNILASEGMKCRLHLVGGQSCARVEIDEEALEVIHKGMVGACSKGGTATPLFDFQPQVACKTGTAEYARENGKIGTHAWLTAYAPADDPTISVTVLVEGGGEGSVAAAPVVRKILAKYFGVEDTFNYGVVEGE